jgi:hypothetical protein
MERMFIKILIAIVFSLTVLTSFTNSSEIDISSFSNIDQIKQSSLAFEFNIDLDNKV